MVRKFSPPITSGNTWSWDIKSLNTGLKQAPNKMSSNPGLGTPSQARIRPRNVQNWKKNKAKTKRNLGQEYVSAYTGKRMAARTIGHNTCRRWSERTAQFFVLTY